MNTLGFLHEFSESEFKWLFKWYIQEPQGGPLSLFVATLLRARAFLVEWTTCSKVLNKTPLTTLPASLDFVMFHSIPASWVNILWYVISHVCWSSSALHHLIKAFRRRLSLRSSPVPSPSTKRRIFMISSSVHAMIV